MFTATAAMLSLPASGQTDPAHRSALIARGFTAAEFKAAERAIVMPHFRYYDAWRRCTRAMVQSGIQMQGNAKQVTELALGACSANSKSLEASLGASLGVATASRVMLLLYRDLTLTVTENNPAVQAASIGQQRIGSWLLTKLNKPKSCMVIRDDNPSSAFMFSRADGRIFMTLWEEGSFSVQHFEKRALEFGNYVTGYDRRVKNFLVMKSADQRYLAFSTELNDDDMDKLKNSFGFRLMADADMSRDARDPEDQKFLFDGKGDRPLGALLAC